MNFTQPTPFAEALQVLKSKSLLPTDASSEQLATLSKEIRQRSIFSARTTNAWYLQKIKDSIQQIIAPEVIEDPQTGAQRHAKPGEYMDKATARLRLKKAITEIGYQPDMEDRGGLKDLSSDARLNLIVRMNAELVQGHGRWLAEQDPARLDAWPAQEFYRLESRKTPRDWVSRWLDAGGKIYAGKMIALKNDPIWEEISAFGLPYPPFDFNSGMWVRDVSRPDAIAVGLMDQDDPSPETAERSINDNLELSVPGNERNDVFNALIQSLGSTADFVDGVLRYRKN